MQHGECLLRCGLRTNFKFSLTKEVYLGHVTRVHQIFVKVTLLLLTWLGLIDNQFFASVRGGPWPQFLMCLEEKKSEWTWATMRLASSNKEVLSEINNSFDIRRSGGQFSQFATGDVAFEVVKNRYVWVVFTRFYWKTLNHLTKALPWPCKS